MKNSIRLLFIISYFVSSTALFAQQKMLVYEGNVYCEDKPATQLSFAFAKGDQIILNVETEKGKELNRIEVATEITKVMYRKSDVESIKDYKIRTTTDQVYTFLFVGPKMGKRLTHITIERIPMSAKTQFFNPAWEYVTRYDTTEVVYQKDRVVGELPAEIQNKELRIFNKYVYQQKPFLKEHKQLLGNVTSPHSVNYPYKFPETPQLEGMQLKHVTYNINSTVGGAKHWEMASLGVTAATMFMNPAAGLASEQAMKLMGPEPGGEPCLYFFSQDLEDAKTIDKAFSASENAKELWNVAKGGSTSNYSLKSVTRTGSVTSLYSISKSLKPEGFLILANTARATAKNTDVNFSAIYYAPTFIKVNAQELVIPLDIQKEDISTKSIISTKEIRILE